MSKLLDINPFQYMWQPKKERPRFDMRNPIQRWFLSDILRDVLDNFAESRLDHPLQICEIQASDDNGVRVLWNDITFERGSQSNKQTALQL
mgnify:CR=1 FL=1